MDLRLPDHPFDVRTGILVICSTIVLTASFLGLLAVVRGTVTDPGTRLPVYVLLTAVVFVVVLFELNDPEEPGLPVLTTTVGVGIGAFILISLSGEGVVFVISRPETLVSSQVLLYLIAAALICTAIAYWGVQHWREFVE